MAQFPPTPPFSHHPNLPAHWPPSGLSHNPPFRQNPSPNYQQPPGGANSVFDHNNNAANFSANAHLPGLGSAGSLPPPPFPFFSSAQFPPVHLPGAPALPPHYPSMSLSQAPIPTLSSHSANGVQARNNSSIPNMEPHPRPPSLAVNDMDREEGELTDQEVGSSMLQHGPVSEDHRDPLRSFPRSSGLPMRSARKPSQLQEAEVRSRSSSRESGSPYNPPLSIDAAPIIPEEMHPETRTSSSSSSDKASDSFGTAPGAKADQRVLGGTKSPAQLRVQAQGALLSLAPHNIRYHELVGEGINPTVLKRLYEEVGIKIASPQPDASAESRSGSAVSLNVAQGTKRTSDVAPQQSATEGSTPVHSPAAQPQLAKPMERKEVIARMLAAKAAKSTEAAGSPQPESMVQTPATKPEQSDLQTETTTTPSEECAKEKETRVREKNKAQTELARQRIEQLKKQGLMRAQQKAQPDTVTQEQASNVLMTEAPTVSSTVVPIHHPLPERPPVPESQASARIPGLFMMESGQAPSHESVPPIQRRETDSTPQPRAHQRKRPRASDFDEPIPIPKRPSSNGANYTPAEERLIIDLSDDELYEDEDDAMDIDDSPERNSDDAAASIAESSLRLVPTQHPPQRSMTVSTSLYSSSATPQYSRNNDPEDLRRKDLEIQAMRRRIAELEQKKKAKMAASRIQSPRASDSTASTPLNTATIDAELSYNLGISKAAQTVTSDQSNRLSSLKTDELEDIKVKLLRKEEIESGIPALDAEIQTFESKLTELKGEEGHVLLEISKGKEGRRQLLRELNDLNLELKGLTLKEVEEELQKVTAHGRQSQVTGEDTTGQEEASDTQEAPTIQRAEIDNEAEKEATAETQLPLSVKAPAAPASAPAVSPSVDNDSDDNTDSSSDVSTSSSESEGSAMDESSDSDSSSGSGDSDSDSEGSEERTSSPRPAASEGVPKSQENAQEKPDGASAEHPTHPLPERPPFTDIINEADVVSNTRECGVADTHNQATSDASSDSEAYEPPEPEATASPPDSDYTPPSNPPSPGPVDAIEINQSPIDQSQNAGELLTGKVQEVESRDDPRSGLLENPPVQESSQHKFSPYVSPLKNFRAYRYHPDYTSGTTDGYRSLTYSHNIDAMKYLCPYESAGGVCNDKSCEFQHFRDMTLSDDKILVQMGSLREGNTPEEKDSYVAGLKEMVNDLRRDKVKDFNTVATEIAAYRRRYLQDPSRILPL
ncbi:hypothetical protein BDV59DRAFT_172063 [Aspergillus ambiguus]|uniref:uncharacterized protein n=1 Tax=Aspergillus ambiguus TaxID=176160 RepID=UPI003CCE059D